MFHDNGLYDFLLPSLPRHRGFRFLETLWEQEVSRYLSTVSLRESFLVCTINHFSPDKVLNITEDISLN